VTYLFEGAQMHRDSVGSLQRIEPGAINWMTAGRGIVHSERSDDEQRRLASTLYGLQCWVALPRADEECAPDFTHLKAADLPVMEAEGVRAVLVAGSYLGLHSSLPTRSPLFYMEVRLSPGARMNMPAEYDEQALYIVNGSLDLGADGVHAPGQLLVTRPGRIAHDQGRRRKARP